MATMAPDEEVAAAPKRRALPFKRTVARKQQSQQSQQSSDEAKKPDDDNDLDLFRHSKEVFPEILREAEEEKDQKQHDRKRRKPSSSSSDDPPHAHKRSTTLNESDDDLIMDVKGKGKEVTRPRRPSTPLGPPSAQAIPATPGSSRAAASRRSGSKNPADSPSLPVTMPDSDSDDEVQPIASSSRRRNASNTATPSGPPRSPSPFSSPIEILPDPQITPDPSAPGDGGGSGGGEADDFSEWVAKARALQASENQTAVVQVITTSRIEGCERPVVTRCRMNQAVQLILRTWVDRTRGPATVIPDDAAARLFLTWKGNKIYGHSTLASLGVQVDARGTLRNDQGEGYQREGIHLEVWTEEAYAEYLEDRGKKRALGFGVDDEDESGLGRGGGGEEEAPVMVQQQRKKGIRIVLKAKDHEPLKLTTREDTTAETLIEAFRTQREVGPEWEVAIWFDGERLEDESLVTDMDIDPDDVNQLEVHVKRTDG